MSYPPATHGNAEQEEVSTAAVIPPDGPPAHEDFTIAEQLESIRFPEEDRPGEDCFLNEAGEKRWVGTSEVQRFIRRLGAEHPSNYFVKHGTSWQQDLFSGF